MKEYPILFSTPMVQAILAGRKTMTRRKLKVKGCKPFSQNPDEWTISEIQKWNEGYYPYGQVGDVLWVRETFQKIEGNRLIYKTDPIFWGGKWNPSIHMPKAAARIWLKITKIKVERLRDISQEDAKAEGVNFSSLFNEWGGVVPHPNITNHFRWYSNPVDAFNNLWISINGRESWESNPWVWAIEFEVLSTTGKPAAL